MYYVFVPLFFLTILVHPSDVYATGDACVVTDGKSNCKVVEFERKFEKSLLSVALHNCKNAKPSKVDPKLLRNLLDIEKDSGVPFKYRGMVLAAACNESGFRANGRRGDGGKAVGLLQMWPWWEKKFNVNRQDPYSSAKGWVSQIVRTVPKAKRKCGKRRAFVSAWAWVASGPKKWRCRAPRHYKRLKIWHRLVKRDLGT